MNRRQQCIDSTQNRQQTIESKAVRAKVATTLFTCGRDAQRTLRVRDGLCHLAP
jgi:hypothetical protein